MLRPLADPPESPPPALFACSLKGGSLIDPCRLRCTALRVRRRCSDTSSNSRCSNRHVSGRSGLEDRCRSWTRMPGPDEGSASRFDPLRISRKIPMGTTEREIAPPAGEWEEAAPKRSRPVDSPPCTARPAARAPAVESKGAPLPTPKTDRPPDSPALLWRPLSLWNNGVKLFGPCKVSQVSRSPWAGGCSNTHSSSASSAATSAAPAAAQTAGPGGATGCWLPAVTSPAAPASAEVLEPSAPTNAPAPTEEASCPFLASSDPSAPSVPPVPARRAPCCAGMDSSSSKDTAHCATSTSLLRDRSSS
mmetsp:Transcript_39613/g.88655  ORF Transcript_39613/g.88655 Transcript_39613/m.88655 type:complete len:306 (-) Transcript_39613:441-1358(-)